MRTLCDKCNKEINTSSKYKSDFAFSYNIEIDTEPKTGSVYNEHRSGYLCHACSKTIYNAMTESIKNGFTN